MNIEKNIINIKKKISIAAYESNRNPQEITLLAVSKYKSCENISDAIKAGQYQFAENYAIEGFKKIQYFSYNDKIIWHFIGSLQTNKTKIIAQYFDWFHALDNEKIAKRLNSQRSHYKSKLNVLIQINISNENSKSGVKLNNLNDLVEKIINMPNLLFRGFMVIPAFESDYNKQYDTFYKVKCIFNIFKNKYSTVDTLSMGMTNDIKAAIHCGSTIVRIGTGIFGVR
ncbi:YggS family pyridoxal phosphate-dependent enzyme [Candidatus Providencia siddallii]|uniref:Pyridoxal phosphate homeostasis protein n=1 Tax=Candidatus Providencia siddallii TaxID=1715285 RepID=A0ABP1CDG0_9GAMM